MKPEREKERERLKSWAMTIATYIKDSSEVEDVWANEFYDITVKCCEKGTFAQLKMLVGDMNESAMGFSSKERMILNRILMEKFGEDLMTRMNRSMDGVLKRGKIRNDDEFVRVNEWIDHLLYDEDNPDAEQQIEQYNQLLSDYDAKVARRMEKMEKAKRPKD